MTNEKTQQEIYRATQRLTFFQEGLTAILHRVARVLNNALPADADKAQVITAASCMNLLQVLCFFISLIRPRCAHIMLAH